MSFENVQNKNPELLIKLINDDNFKEYGKIINDTDVKDYIEYMQDVQIPETGNIYAASIEDMEKLSVTNIVKSNFYGDMPVQIGYCNGQNRLLNGLEYHKGSELLVAVTDLILILGKVSDMVDNTYHSSKVEIFYVEKGTAIEMYQTTLHYSPCKVEEAGFKAVIILPKGTNTEFDEDITKISSESKLLFKKNKWLLVHESDVTAVEKGAYVGVKGQNISVII